MRFCDGGVGAPGAELQEAAARSTKVGNEDMPDDVRWIRSYVLAEGDGTVGTVCIYEAKSPEAIRKHAAMADLPVDEVIPVADTVVVRPDPQPAEGVGPAGAPSLQRESAVADQILHDQRRGQSLHAG